MAERVDRLGEAPPHNAAAHSAALAKHIGQGSPPAAGQPYKVFQPESPEGWPPFVRWVRGALRDKVNALVEFTADIEDRAVVTRGKVANHETRLDAVEAQLAAQPRPFP